jgi:hypothetical protein
VRARTLLEDTAVLEATRGGRAGVSEVVSPAAAEPALPRDATQALALLLLELANVTVRIRQLSDDLPPRLRARTQALHLAVDRERTRWFPEVG